MRSGGTWLTKASSYNVTQRSTGARAQTVVYPTFSCCCCCCSLMTGLLLLLFRWAPYGGAGCVIGTPKTAAAVAGAAACGGSVAAQPSVPWLTIIPQVSLLGGRTTAAPPPFLSSAIFRLLLSRMSNSTVGNLSDELGRTEHKLYNTYSIRCL